MEKVKSILIGLISSHIFWAVVSFGLVLLFTGLTQYDYGWSWKTTMLVINCILFILFALGAVGLSIFNLVIYLIKKIRKK